MADIFVSYARADKARVTPLVAALEAQGWSVWWDPHITPGQEFDELIALQLDQTRVVIVVWSPAAVQSRWVRGEARVGADRGILVPVRFDAAQLPIDARAIHTIDLDGWADDAHSPAFQHVVRAVNALLTGGHGHAAPAAAHHAAHHAAAHHAAAHHAAPPTPERTGISVCVLPFANMSGDPEQEYFSDGVSEDIITDLSKVSALFVVARNTAFTFKGKSMEVPQIARQLNVGYVLEGSVRKSGNRVRITGQLIDGATGGHVWAERYDRDLDDIFALQDEISQAIVAALKLKLLPEEKKAIARRGTENAEAYNLYLMARQEYLNGRGSTRPYEALVRLCQQAVKIDPNYAEAWGLLALGRAYRGYAAGQHGREALEDAERALALDDHVTEAHAAKAWVFFGEKGRLDDAITEAQRALALDPESFDANEVVALTHFREGRIEEASRYWERVVQLFDQDISSPSMLLTCYQAMGRPEDTRRVAEIGLARTEKILAHDRNNGRALGHGALALAALGLGERAKEWMNRALLVNPDASRYNFACTLASYLNDAEGALEMIAPAFKTMGPGLLAHAKVDPDMDPVRDDPRFQAMLAEAEARLAASAEAGAGQAATTQPS